MHGYYQLRQTQKDVLHAYYYVSDSEREVLPPSSLCSHDALVEWAKVTGYPAPSEQDYTTIAEAIRSHTYVRDTYSTHFETLAYV